MVLDQVTLSFATALVVVVSGVFFIAETLLRRDDGAGRVWSLGFLGAMLTTLLYMVWAYDPQAMWSVVIGNATFVSGTGCMWLGCRYFNARRMSATSLVVAGAAVGASAAVVLAGPDAGSWAGALWMFLALMVFAGLGAAEALRGEMGRYRTARALAVVLGLQSLFYVGRVVVVLIAGFDSDVFNTYFGVAAASILTVILTIVAVVVTSVLRADRAAERGPLLTASVSLLGTGGILPRASFLRVLDQALGRASARGEQIAVVAVRIDDLPQIATAFGDEIAHSVAQACRDGIARLMPALSLIGEDGATGMLTAFHASSEPDARRLAGQLYRGLVDVLGRVSGGIVPVVGVGMSLSEPGGGTAEDIVASAQDAGLRASRSVGVVIVAEDVREP